MVLVPISPMSRPIYMLSDAALDPLYSSDPDPIEVYKWVAANADGFDAEKQNAWGDLPMKAAEIKDPDDDFRGTAPKDLSKSCAATGKCEDEFNAWAFLVDSAEAKTLKKRKDPAPADEAWEAWSNIPLSY
jgi:hypothetical protein